jgi:hypothetical protein
MFDKEYPKPFRFDYKHFYFPGADFESVPAYKYADGHSKAVIKRIIKAVLDYDKYYYRECRSPLVYTIVPQKHKYIEIMIRRVWEWGGNLKTDRVCWEVLSYLEKLGLKPVHIEAEEGKAHLLGKEYWELSATLRIHSALNIADANGVLMGLIEPEKSRCAGPRRSTKSLTDNIISLLDEKGPLKLQAIEL